jgi:DNA-binding MarR family transcriptional regulator
MFWIITNSENSASMSVPLAEPQTGDPLRLESATSIVGYRLRRAQLAVFQRFLATFAHLDLRPAEYSVLTLIRANPGRKQSEIAAVLGIKRANFVALINNLERRGLTERRVAATDGRANALYLTASGRAFEARARRVHDQFESASVQMLGGPGERDRLVELLDRLIV